MTEYELLPALPVAARRRDLPARRSGFVHFDVRAGEVVVEGAPLFHIEVPEDDFLGAELRARVRVASREVGVESVEHERRAQNAGELEALYGVVAEQQVRSARFDVAGQERKLSVARARVAAARTGLEAHRDRVGASRGYASFGGTVARLEVDEGTWVEQGQAIVRLESTRASRLRVAFTPEQLVRLQGGGQVLWGRRPAPSWQPCELDWWSPRPDEVTGLHLVELSYASTAKHAPALGELVWVHLVTARDST